MLPGLSYAGVRVRVVDEFRPDRSRLPEQLRSELENQIDVSTYPEDGIELLSRLVAEAHPIVAEHGAKLGIVGVELPDPVPLWEALQGFCLSLLEVMPALPALHAASEA